MQGNKLQAFLIMLVMGFAAMFVALITCGIGFLFAYPFLEVIQGMMYSKATGQYQNMIPGTAG